MKWVFDIAWLIIIFPALGLTFNAFFSTRFKEEIASYVAIAASGLAFVMSALVLIALMGLPPEARSVPLSPPRTPATPAADAPFAVGSSAGEPCS